MSPRLFVLVSGLPASGKTTVARAVGPLLGLPVIDKDDILDALFEAEGTGDSAWRRELSRRSDVLFRAEAEASSGAVLTSFWHTPGMDASSGTPTDWVLRLSPFVVGLHCVCPPEVAADRFLTRQRHRGHLDAQRDPAEVRATFAALAQLEAPRCPQSVVVDTDAEYAVAAVVAELHDAFRQVLPRIPATADPLDRGVT